MAVCCCCIALVRLFRAIFLQLQSFIGGESMLGFIFGCEGNTLDVKLWPEATWTGRTVGAKMVAFCSLTAPVDYFQMVSRHGFVGGYERSTVELVVWPANLYWPYARQKDSSLMLFLNPTGGFSRFFPARVGFLGSSSRLGGVRGTRNRHRWVTGGAPLARGLRPYCLLPLSSFSSLQQQHKPLLFFFFFKHTSPSLHVQHDPPPFLQPSFPYSPLSSMIWLLILTYFLLSLFSFYLFPAWN